MQNPRIRFLARLLFGANSGLKWYLYDMQKI
jgi:hypothetical protein